MWSKYLSLYIFEPEVNVHILIKLNNFYGYNVSIIRVKICPRGKMIQYHQFVFYLNTHFYSSLINIGSISSYSASDPLQSHHLLGCNTTNINSSFNSLLSSLRFPNLECQVKSLIKIIILGSSSSKLSSRLTLLKLILTISISSELNTASVEY